MRWFLVLGLCLGTSIVGTGVADELTINPDQRLLEAAADAQSVPVGLVLGDVAVRDVEGHTIRVSDQQATAFVFLSTRCPLAKRYTQRLNRWHAEFASSGTTADADGADSNGVLVVGVFSNLEDQRDDVIAYGKKMQLEIPLVKDENGYLARRLGARMTPQAVIVDGQGRLRYRGALDDNRYVNRVRDEYLRDALTAILNGGEPEACETKSLGCSIHLEKAAEVAEVTYTQHVARILQDNCQTCHRPGQVAPFSLVDYEDAKTWATEIDAYARARLMPPWKAAAGFGRFQHERRLSDNDLVLIERWLAGGTPEGPTEAQPPAPVFHDQWPLGPPDLVLEMPETYTIGPEGEDDYRHFIVPTHFDRPVYVRAADVIPGNRQTVHHVLLYVDTSGKARELDAADPGPGYTRFGGVGFEPVSGLGGWAPGSAPVRSPEGTGFWLPPGADVVMQVHYYRTGVEETDRTKVGLYFSEHPQPARIHTVMAINHEFVIPAGDSRYKVEAHWRAKEPVYAISVAPHMHLLGTEMKVTATLPDGSIEPLIWIKDWDFNWQGSYHFERPLHLPAGTTIDVVSYFDNSAKNPHNPHDPPRPVGWGEKTTDEMCIAFVDLLKAKDWQPGLANSVREAPTERVSEVTTTSP